jgi:hypothetical protein
MSQEITFYTLFILLTVSMGIVFQFMLAKIKALDNSQKAIMKSLSFVHGEVLKVKKDKNIGSSPEPFGDRSKASKSTRRGARVLKGDLTLEYRGAIADTRATFMLDED